MISRSSCTFRGQSPLLVLLSTFASLLLLAPAGTDACSPLEGYEPPPVEKKVHESDLVVSGKVLMTYPSDKNIPEGYSVDMQVYCVFKGEQVPQRIRIHDVGAIPGLCITTELKQNSTYIVYLRKDVEQNGVRYVPEFSEDPGSLGYMEETGAVCDVIISYPVGITEENTPFACPKTDMDYIDDCIPYPPIDETIDGEEVIPPMPPTIGGEVAPPMPPKEQGSSPKNRPQLDGKGDKQAAPTPGLNPATGEKGGEYESVVDTSGQGQGQTSNSKGDPNSAMSATSCAWLAAATLTASIFVL